MLTASHPRLAQVVAALQLHQLTASLAVPCQHLHQKAATPTNAHLLLQTAVLHVAPAALAAAAVG
jgi:hypothetical protein